MPPSASPVLEFAQAGILPALGDNVAIASRTLPAGTRIAIRQLVFEFSHTVLEGHRFAIFPIRKGGALLSWGLPFGRALREIEPGEYVCNEKILRALSERATGLALPAAPNFADDRLAFALEEAPFQPADQFLHAGAAPTFQGFRRAGRRGAGTRNYIVVMGASARTGAFARAVASRFGAVPQQWPNVDGVVAVDHTEGAGESSPRNLELSLRTLAGFMLNPNVAAVLCADFGAEALSNARLKEHAFARGLDSSLPHRFYTIDRSFEAAVDEGARQVEAWLPQASASQREAIPVSGLNLGLQCGGSDAFSGVSGNPLAGILAREVVAWGGRASLAETDELIGAETYVLQKVRDLETARAFLEKIRRFQEWAGWHGHSAEGNPSGGNMYRGLYNITLKSIGAARKKDPATRLDWIIDFGAPMPEPGFYFMDSPGNDLESIAGQVASGCNTIVFATGNGSITNFPFVPTIKIMTTTARFELVRQEMDFNAGRLQDGEPLEDLGGEAFELLRRIASGQPSAGERAGHAQVQLWREWRQDRATAAQPVAPPPASALRGPAPLRLDLPAPAADAALVLPTSLCSGQIARIVAERLNSARAAAGPPRLRAVTLAHTEGCGNSGGESEQLFLRTMAGYLAHPLVAHALLLEHGCEKTHNDAFRQILRELDLPASRFGWASVQMDGGIEKSVAKALAWFRSQPVRSTASMDAPPGLGVAGRRIPAAALEMLRHALFGAARAGGLAVAAENAGLIGTGEAKLLEYGQRATAPGLYLMRCPTDDLAETLTGLGATGVPLLAAWDSAALVPGNPLVPTLQLADASELPEHLREDVDLLLDPAAPNAAGVADLLQRAASGIHIPRSRAMNNLAFQITRGLTGISL
jgi:altronate dehydratase